MRKRLAYMGIPMDMVLRCSAESSPCTVLLVLLAIQNEIKETYIYQETILLFSLLTPGIDHRI